METIKVLACNVIIDLEKHKILVDQNIEEEGGFFIDDEWVCLQSEEDQRVIETLRAA